MTDLSLPSDAQSTSKFPLDSVIKNLGQSPLAFERNDGQIRSDVEFLSRGRGYNVFLTRTEAVLAIASQARANVSRKQSEVVRLKLEDSCAEAKLIGEDALPGRSNYFIGNNPAHWRTNVPTYSHVRYSQVYRGIDLIYYGNGRQLEFDFELAPNANPAAIRLSFAGVRKIRLDAKGDLILKGRHGELRQKKPLVYQEVNGQRNPIEGNYVLTGGNVVGFEIGAYDESRPLVIDPVLVYSTYLGGSGNDYGNSLAIDSSGNVYVTGETNSLNFPTNNPYQGTVAASSDVFITKFDATGSSPIYSTYLGGAGLDRGDGIAVDLGGSAYLIGRMDSASVDFPVTAGAFQTTYRGGDFDGFVTKLNAQGNGLVYSTFLGGNDNDSPIGLTVDSNGSVYITGGTKSVDYPVSITGYQTNIGGDTDAFVTKLNPAGSLALYSTYVGGSSTDRGSGIAVDASGNAFVAGLTRSEDFPTVNAAQGAHAGTFDAFIIRVNTNGTDLDFSTYLGGAGDDRAFGLALDSSANCYVTGQTSSSNFPVANALFSTFSGSFDAFIAKLDSAGTKLYATYLGGSGDDRATAIAVGANQPNVTGFTSSTNFPISGPLQATKAGGTDAFVTKLNASGTSLIYSTYLGGTANENFNNQNITYSGGIAADSSGNAYVTGFTFSNNFPTAMPFQAGNAGSSDAFIIKISDTSSSGDFTIAVSPSNRLVVPGGQTTYDVTVTPSGGFAGQVTLSVGGLPANTNAGFNPLAVNITNLSSVTSTLTVTTTGATPLGEAQLIVTGTAGSLLHSGATKLNVVSPSSADVALTKTGSPNPASVGINLSYRIVVTNNGPAGATGVTTTDTLPGTVTFVSATPTQGNCMGTTTITCSLGSLAVNASASVTIVVTPTQATTLSNTASVSRMETDPVPSNDSQTILTTVQSLSSGPTMLDSNLAVTTVATDLNQPTSMAFLSANDFFVLEQTTGKVQRVVNGVPSTVLDLAVNGASERGLLGIALHPDFAANGFVYLFWTESSTGVDTSNIDEIPLLGNRVDRYTWNGSALAFDRNLIKLRSLQQDASQPSRGNHNGGVLRFGLDNKLYILFGDNGRRGFLQNVTSGAPVPDDQFGGPEPDNAHLTGVILRLNDDGTTPTDNPFFDINSGFTGEAAANVKKVYAYGVRNGFGMGVDPLSGNMWTQENGDDAFDEMNRVHAGFNGGWAQIMGPVSRVAEYKSIETTYGNGTLQQLRWAPNNIADTPAAALSSLYMLLGTQYTDPEFSWKFAVAPSALGFIKGRGLGLQYEGDMFVGASRTTLVNGYLFRFKFTGDRQHFSFSDPLLTDLVADNTDKFDLGESESLLVGRDFGVATDVQTGPNGNLFVVSLSNGAVYEITSKPSQLFVATLNGGQEVPPTNSTATGTATIILGPDDSSPRLSLSFSGLSSQQTGAHIHGPAAPGSDASVIVPLPLGQVSDFQISLTPSQVQNLKDGLLYVNVHTTTFSDGEIRGQFQSSAAASSVQFNSTTYAVNEGEGSATVEVRRAGNTSVAVTIEYVTTDATASNRTDYTTSSGTLRFAAGEIIKTFTVPIVDDLYVESSETINLILSNPTGGAFAGSPATVSLTIIDNDVTTPTINPLDNAQFFVNQHYLDFLSREPDLGGLAYWTNEITKCGNNTTCVVERRSSVSAAFFIEAEFQRSGSFVYLLYKGALGRQPTYSEFTIDRSKVVGGVETDKTALTEEFVQRSEFQTLYPAMTNAQFVNKLFDTAGLTPFTAERQQQIDAMNLGKKRSQVVRDLVEIQALKDREYNPSFVLMQYFGYLRRNPDLGGYAFWLDVVNNRDPNNYRGMVCAFITSPEYQERFSPVVTRNDVECAVVH